MPAEGALSAHLREIRVQLAALERTVQTALRQAEQQVGRIAKITTAVTDMADRLDQLQGLLGGQGGVAHGGPTPEAMGSTGHCPEASSGEVPAPGPLGSQAVPASQALADVAAAHVGARAAPDDEAYIMQLQAALEDRVAVARATGILAQHGYLSLDAAAAALRRYAEDHDRHRADIARALMVGDLDPEGLVHSYAPYPTS